MPNPFPQWQWIDLYSDEIREPHSWKRKYYFQCEVFLSDEQYSNPKSCYFKVDLKKLNKFSKKQYKDMFGNLIFNGDLVYLPDKRYEDKKHVWKVLYGKGSKLVVQCITPGYEKYRTKILSHHAINLTGAMIENQLRLANPITDKNLLY